MSNSIKVTVRHGGALYGPDSTQAQIAQLITELSPRSCRRLLDAGAVEGEGFADRADDGEPVRPTLGANAEYKITPPPPPADADDGDDEDDA